MRRVEASRTDLNALLTMHYGYAALMGPLRQISRFGTRRTPFEVYCIIRSHGGVKLVRRDSRSINATNRRGDGG